MPVPMPEKKSYKGNLFERILGIFPFLSKYTVYKNTVVRFA